MIDQNLGRGLLLTGVALFFLVQAPGYKIGTFNNPGSGFFPLVVSGLLFIISIAIIARSFLIPRVALEFKWNSIAILVAGIIAFAVLSQYVNMIAGIVALVVIASLASDDFSASRTAVLTVALVGVAFAMRFGLKVNLPLY